MEASQTIADALDETIQALAYLDLDRLQILERRVAALEKSDVPCRRDHLDPILKKRHLLGRLLQNCELNLDALNRLHGRNMRDKWVR
jgi:hypothetical protein